MKNKELRTEQILDLLSARPEIRVTDISKQLNISEVTIRKDLDFLAKKGKVVRIHGGAKLIQNTHLNQSEASKIAIAQAAERLINDDDIISISSGSTCLHVCDAFRKKENLLILTNSFAILNKIIQFENVTTFFLGGKVNRSMQITTGSDLGEQLHKYTADKLFLGMDGIDSLQGATTYNYAEKDIMREMMGQAKTKIIVADGSKIGRVTFAKIADLNEFDILITNSTLENEDNLKKIEATGIQVIRA